jgi:hypothetical protein
MEWLRLVVSPIVIRRDVCEIKIELIRMSNTINTLPLLVTLLLYYQYAAQDRRGIGDS